MSSHADEDFELQPSEAKRQAPAQGPSPEYVAEEPASPDVPPPYAPPITDEPPPREKVDFENLPEFVWQRKMLRNVRIGAVIGFTILVIVLIVSFLGAGKGAKDSLKNVIEGEKPVPESESKP